MKKTWIVILAAAFTVVAAACGAPSSSSTPTGAEASSGTNGQSPLTQEQLVLGSLELEKTDMAISAEQAGSLLPLWQAYQSLLQSDTTAQAEISALLAQIEGEMTSEQLAAITAMDVSTADIPAMMEDLGLQMATPDGANGGGRTGAFFGNGEQPQGIPEGVTPGQFSGGGGQGPGGRFAGGAEGLSPEQIATFQAQNQDFGNRAGRGSVFLVRPLIALLESKLG
jgi:hypothetical protein